LIVGAQKNKIPFLRAYEALPREFRCKDANKRRQLFLSDANFVSFKKMFQPQRIKYDKKQFYICCNLLVRDMQLPEKIVPFNEKLMCVKYIRDLNIPLAIYSIVQVLLQKYKKYQTMMQNDDKMDAKWKELSEYESAFVDCSSKKKFDFPMKLLFDTGICGERESVSPVDCMALIVIGIACIYRLDKTLQHKENENPTLNATADRKMPALKHWFDLSLKYKFVDSKRMNEIPKMFGFDTADRQKKGGLCNDNIVWIIHLTKQFVERHYGVKSNATLIKKFIDRKNKKVNKKYTNLNKEYREQTNRSLNEYTAMNSFSCGSIGKGNADKFSYHGYKQKDDGKYSSLYTELLLLCSSRIGIKMESLQQRLEQIMRKILIVFEYDDAMQNGDIGNAKMPSDISLNRLKKKKCTDCGIQHVIDRIVECCNDADDCAAVLCKKCLLKAMDNDTECVDDLFIRNRLGLLKYAKWKCPKCES